MIVVTTETVPGKTIKKPLGPVIVNIDYSEDMDGASLTFKLNKKFEDCAKEVYPLATEYRQEIGVVGMRRGDSNRYKRAFGGGDGIITSCAYAVY